MRVLLTGGSSFTGFWFASELARRGHEVTTAIRGAAGDYEGIRRRRVERVARISDAVFDCAFGSERFLDLVLGAPRWDVLCHHAAQVAGYRSSSFDVIGALHANTLQLPDVFQALATRNCSRVVLTGSVFENDEGRASPEPRAFSPYGLSKGLTAQVFRYHADRAGFRLGKFVIANPFGPLEEPRFTDYLVRTWYAGEVPVVRAPDYVRDNIHVSLLARAYAHFVEGLPVEAGYDRFGPSGYVESQAEFAQRFAKELEPRLGIACPVSILEQVEFEEPRERVNTDVLDATALEWSEAGAWDELARYYRETHLPVA
jgi:nucleoside-diphosphate-sugar epimerase